MNNEPATFTIGPFGNEQDLINHAIDLLRRRGFVVRHDDAPWETPARVRDRFHMASSSLTQKLASPRCPWFAARRGPTGRIITMRVNPDLKEWLQGGRK